MRACRARGSLARLREPFVRDAGGVDDGNVAAGLPAGFDLAVPVADEPLTHCLRVGLGDLAAEKADGEARHDGKRLTAYVEVRSPAAVLDPPLDAIAVELGVVRDEVADVITRCACRREPSASTASAAMFASARSVAGSSSSRRSACRTSTETPLSAAFRSLASTACGSKSNARTGAKPSFTAAIESTPEPQPMSSTLPRSSASSNSRQSCVVGCAAGAEGTARVDDDRDRARVRRLPGRADPEPADPDGLVELPPAVLPVLLDVGDRRASERLPDPLLAGRVRVRGDLEPAHALDLLEALREELEHHGTSLSAARRGRSPRRA